MTTIYKVIENEQSYEEGHSYVMQTDISYHLTEDSARNKVGQLLTALIQRTLNGRENFINVGGSAEFYDKMTMRITANVVMLYPGNGNDEKEHPIYDVVPIELED